MFNTILALEFLIYILSLLLGFRMHRKSKSKLNKKYQEYKMALYFMISLIFFVSQYILLRAALINHIFWYLFVINSLFIIYFFIYSHKKTRCWKQHRMIIYNFFIILFIYIASVSLNENTLNYIIIIIATYNILEFQFALFNLKQPLIWD